MIQADTKARPCYLKFRMESVEDRAASLSAGHPVYIQEPWVEITPPGTSGITTVLDRPAKDWVTQKKFQRDPFHEYYQQTLDAFLKGEDEPVNGTPLVMWPAAKPHEIEACKRANIRSVEDLAGADEQTIAKIGMGARTLQMKAREWIKLAKDVGIATEQIVSLKEKVDALTKELAELKKTPHAALSRKEAVPVPEGFDAGE